MGARPGVSCSGVALLAVVVDELFDAGLDPVALGEDLVGGGGRNEWFRAGVRHKPVELAQHDAASRVMVESGP
jgi:hypothetical protein